MFFFCDEIIFDRNKNIAKTFRATIFAIRNHTLSDKPPGWSYDDVENLGWLKDLLNKPVDILDNF